MKLPLKDFKAKYPQPAHCGLNNWYSSLGYCWGFAGCVDAHGLKQAQKTFSKNVVCINCDEMKKT